MKEQQSSTAETAIDDDTQYDTQYAYRDGGVEPVEGGSGRRVEASGSCTGDLDTPLVVTTGVSGHAAESAGCSSRPATEVEPLDLPARPPNALVARDDAIPAEAGKCLPPQVVQAQATDLSVSGKGSISTRDAAAAESVSASAPESEVVDMTTDSGDDEGTWATVASHKRKLNVGGRVAPPPLISPPIGRLQIVEDSPRQKLIPKKMCLSDSGSDSD